MKRTKRFCIWRYYTQIQTWQTYTYIHKYVLRSIKQYKNTITHQIADAHIRGVTKKVWNIVVILRIVNEHNEGLFLVEIIPLWPPCIQVGFSLVKTLEEITFWYWKLLYHVLYLPQCQIFQSGWILLWENRKMTHTAMLGKYDIVLLELHV